MGNDEEVLKSLPLLQDRIKKDPEAYRSEFLLQLEHFESAVELAQANPQRPEKSFHELVMFIAQTSGHYLEESERLIGVLFRGLLEASAIIHATTRKTFLNALFLLRRKNVVSMIRLLPVLFELLQVPDKIQRKFIFNFIVKDFTRNKRTQGTIKLELQKYLLSELKSSQESRAKMATKILIDLYRKDAWRDERIVNAIAEGCFSPQKKVAEVSAHFLLGNYTPLMDEQSTDDDDDKPKHRTARAPIGSKKTRAKTRKVDRDSEALKRKEERREKREMIITNFSGGAILDSIRDPQRFADRLLSRLTSSKKVKDTFSLRLVLLNCVSRFIGKYNLLVPNFYPLVQRYLNPHQKQVTAVMAVCAQGCHELVPPEDIYPIVDLLINQFITETQRPEVIAVGLNAVREICLRAPLGLTESMLESISDFRSFKHKSVVAGARSIINLYRDIYPELLNRKLRGKAAAMNIIHDKAPRPEFGQSNVATSIDGVQYLNEVDTESEHSETLSDLEAGSEQSSASPDESSDADDTDGEEEPCGGEEEPCSGEESEGCNDTEDNLGSKKRGRHQFDPTLEFLTEAHFRKIRKLARGEDPDEEELNGEETSDSEVELPVAEGVVRPEDLKSRIKPKGRAHRLAISQAGRKDRQSFVQKVKASGRSLKASLPESVKRRNKPLMMVKRNRIVRDKQHLDVATRVANLRKHMKTIKKSTGGKKKYRRM